MAMAVAASVAFVSCEEKGNEIKNTAVTGVTLDAAVRGMLADDTFTLTATVLPEGATNPAITWDSSDKAVATVENGVVTALADGVTKITVETEEGEFVAECEVTVSLLGEVTFRTDKIWTIEGDDISQEWSDAVMASGARGKTDFYGGTHGVATFEVDICQNEGYGDYFSWKAVADYPELICPGEWRVPSQQDFVNLDLAMGGTGENRMFGDGLGVEAYLENWGGEFGGYAWFYDGVLNFSLVGTYASYWGEGESSDANGCGLQFGDEANRFVTMKATPAKYSGFTVRCVRDVVEN